MNAKKEKEIDENISARVLGLSLTDDNSALIANSTPTKTRFVSLNYM
jgi:hypothetical protein